MHEQDTTATESRRVSTPRTGVPMYGSCLGKFVYPDSCYKKVRREIADQTSRRKQIAIGGFNLRQRQVCPGSRF